jgi:hypothetical protein
LPTKGQKGFQSNVVENLPQHKKRNPPATDEALGRKTALGKFALTGFCSLWIAVVILFVKLPLKKPLLRYSQKKIVDPGGSR